ncbi:MAG: hypothetical protein HC934_00400 [Acaryochloridaceae cyanobacterium SU_2_1]|nr:hypothetical protein [Acaryochloridaceae cyanobacterium SU_2_1]
MGFLNALAKPLGWHDPKTTWSKLIGCFLTLPWLCLPAMGHCVSALQGQEYTALPPQFCQGYTDALLGQQDNRQYGSVICDRPEGTYFFSNGLSAIQPKNKPSGK